MHVARRRPIKARPGTTVTLDEDGTQHEQIYGVTKLLKQDLAVKERLNKVMEEFRENLRTIKASEYLLEVLEETTKEGDAAQISQQVRENLELKGSLPSAGEVGSAWVCLDVMPPTETSPAIQEYQQKFAKRAEYTIGSNRLLHTMEENSKSIGSTTSPISKSAPKKIHYPASPTSKVRLNRACKIMKSEFDEARTKRDQVQGTHTNSKILRSQARRRRFRDAIKTVIQHASKDRGGDQDEDADIYSMSPKRPSGKPRCSNLRFRRHTIGARTAGTEEASLMSRIAESNINRRNVGCGQALTTLKPVARLMDSVASDLKLNKKTWSIRSTRSKAKPSKKLKSRKKTRRRGGSFLMLANPHSQMMSMRGTKKSQNSLPDNKQHWLTIQAGPHARAAAIQTERLQRTAMARKAKAGVEGIASGQHAVAAEQKRLREWKQLVMKLRFSGGKRHAINNDKMRSQVVSTVSDSENTLKKWRQGFQNLDINYSNRLKNALLIRDLHSKEMNTREHIGYILSHIEKKSGKRMVNGSEVLQPEDRPNVHHHGSPRSKNQKKKQITANSDGEQNWKPDRLVVPKIIKSGPLTSFWTEARNSRITKSEVDSLGCDVVNFWQMFCLYRTSFTGPVAVGEEEMCQKLKYLLQDGQQINDEVVHDIMVLFDEDALQSNPRIKKLIQLLRDFVATDAMAGSANA